MHHLKLLVSQLNLRLKILKLGQMEKYHYSRQLNQQANITKLLLAVHIVLLATMHYLSVKHVKVTAKKMRVSKL